MSQSDPHQTESNSFQPQRIVSGGQTGVDRAALEVAIAIGFDHGGWCPAGRRAEDGTIPSRYQLTETESTEYPVRTEQNVVDSDATLILYRDKLKGGTLLTRRICDRSGKPFLLVRIEKDPRSVVRQWLNEQRPAVLNVAGPRESTCSGVFDEAFEYLLGVWSDS